MSRTLKRLMILLVFLSIIFVFIFMAWLFNRKPPSCNDGKKNQNETGVDCGGVCRPCEESIKTEDLEVLDVNILYGGVDKYDVAIKLRNPNILFGARSMKYKIELLDDSDEILSEKEGESFILPNQERYVFEFNINTKKEPKKVNFKVISVDWVKFMDYDDPDFLIQDVRVGKTQGVDYAKVVGLVRNNSDYDFYEVEVCIAVKDPDDKIIAIQRTIMRNFQAKDERGFELPWPYKFPGVIDHAEVYVYTNVFDSSNFLEQYLPPSDAEKYQ